MRLLLVEDEPDIRRLMAYVLRKAGFTVSMAGSVAEAEEVLSREAIDALLLDLMLPGEDGYSFCRRLKADPLRKGIPVIVVSARVLPSEIQQAFDCGANGYIVKPYDPATLAAEVHRQVLAAGTPRAGEAATGP